MDGVDMVLERRIPTEKALAEAACEWLQLHMNALSMILEMRYRFKGLPTFLIGTLEGPVPVRMSKKVIFQMLFLLECLIAALVRAGELSFVALEVPVELALRNELTILTDVTLKF